MQFYPLIVKEVRRETLDCVSVAFEVPETLREVFAYLGPFRPIYANVCQFRRGLDPFRRDLARYRLNLGVVWFIQG